MKDYSWLIYVGLVALVVIFWKPITGFFQGASNSVTNKPAIERGKQVFYDTERWYGKGSYRSCAMCHDPAFTPAAGKTVEMTDYKPGQPVVLKKMKNKYGNVVTGDQELYTEINQCIVAPTRLHGGKFTMEQPHIKDLMAYVRSL
jgi:hypothetical protein